MSLSSGTRLGSYEIVAPLGEGGMGAVYRARDTKLGRAVAIKVILDEFASSEERVGRFEREAKMLAALHHQRIASLFGLEHADGRHFLVMELVEGETLAERLRGGAVPVEEALPIVIQIAEALEAAHEKGVVHRDLKPANVKITPDGQVKVLDFGLAKAIENESTAGSAANSPTLSMVATQAGLILGTAAYMSPEQAKGFPADHRSDIFSFGVVLAEMLSGRQPFRGDTAPEILASILVREPDTSGVPADLNPRLLEIIERCLAKNPKKRWQAIGDVRAELEVIAGAPRATSTSGGVPRSWWQRALPIAATAILAATIAASAAWLLKPVPAERVVHLSLPLPPGQTFTGPLRPVFDVAPDGQLIAYVAGNRLYVRRLSEAAPVAITGSDTNPLTPVFSPDGRSIAFYSPNDQTIKTIPVNGGTPVTVGAAQYPLGLAWFGDHIIFGHEFGQERGIDRLPAAGGEAERVVKISGNEQAYGPRVLPDGENLLFTLASGQGSDRWDRAKIMTQSLRTGAQKVLIAGGSDARYLPTGHLVYAVGGNLFAVRFDSRRLEVSGPPVSILRGVKRAAQSRTGVAQFAFAPQGILAYIAGPVSGAGDTYGIALFDRSGNQVALKVPPGSYESPRVSPDGKRIAFGGTVAGVPGVFLADLTGKTPMQPVADATRSRLPVWCGPKQLIFQSDRDKDLALFRQTVDSGHMAERLTKPDPGVEHIPEACSPDGKTLLFSVAKSGSYSLWSLSLADGKVAPFASPSLVPTGARFSHDGSWVAYCVRAGALTTLFVEPYPQTGARYQLLRGTAEPHHPLWTPDDTELLYIPGPGAFEGVPIQRQPTFTFGEHFVMRRNFFAAPPSMPSTYDVLPDGRIVALASGEAEGGGSEIRIVLNWFEELKSKLPK